MTSKKRVLPYWINVRVESRHGEGARPGNGGHCLMAKAVQEAFGRKCVEAYFDQVLVFRRPVRGRDGFSLKEKINEFSPKCIAKYKPTAATAAYYVNAMRSFDCKGVVKTGEFTLFRAQKGSSDNAKK